MTTDFEVVTSGDWIEVSNVTQLIDNYPGGEMEVMGFVLNKTFAFIDGVVESTGIVTLGNTIIDAKILPTTDIAGERLRMWIKLGPA